jgi:hypothetical protein
MLHHWFRAKIKRRLHDIENNIMVEDNETLIANFSLFAKG